MTTGPDIRPHDPDDPGDPTNGREQPVPPSVPSVPSVPSGPDRGRGLPRVNPEMGITQCPPFSPDTVDLGPFDREPFALQDITYRMPNGNMRQPADNSRCLAEWLTGALDAAGVRLGAFDRLQVHLIATDGWGPVQAVAGWVTRARHGDPPEPTGPPTESTGSTGSTGPPVPPARPDPPAVPGT